MRNALTIDVEDYFQVSALAPYIARIEWDERDGHSAVIDHVRSVRIHVDVEFSQRGGVALVADGPAHDDHLPHRPDDARVLAEGDCHVCQWADADQGELARRGHDSIDQELDAVLRDGRSLRSGELSIAQPAIPVGLGRKQ